MDENDIIGELIKLLNTPFQYNPLIIESSLILEK